MEIKINKPWHLPSVFHDIYGHRVRILPEISVFVCKQQWILIVNCLKSHHVQSTQSPYVITFSFFFFHSNIRLTCIITNKWNCLTYQTKFWIKNKHTREMNFFQVITKHNFHNFLYIKHIQCIIIILSTSSRLANIRLLNFPSLWFFHQEKWTFLLFF